MTYLISILELQYLLYLFISSDSNGFKICPLFQIYKMSGWKFVKMLFPFSNRWLAKLELFLLFLQLFKCFLNILYDLNSNRLNCIIYCYTRDSLIFQFLFKSLFFSTIICVFSSTLQLNSFYIFLENINDTSPNYGINL